MMGIHTVCSLGHLHGMASGSPKPDSAKQHGCHRVLLHSHSCKPCSFAIEGLLTWLQHGNTFVQGSQPEKCVKFLFGANIAQDLATSSDLRVRVWLQAQSLVQTQGLVPNKLSGTSIPAMYAFLAVPPAVTQTRQQYSSAHAAMCLQC